MKILLALLSALPLLSSGTPTAEVFDVVVAGGTARGVAAALRAAQAGERVLVIAPRSALGEDLAGTLRLRPEDGADLPAELRQCLYAANPEARSAFGGVTPLQLKTALDAALLEAKIPCRTWLQPCDIATDEHGNVTGLWIAGRRGRELVRAKAVIDATVDAALARRAGVLPPLPAGKVAFSRHVIAGTAPAASNLTVEAISPGEIIEMKDQQAQFAPGAGLPTVVTARLWRCTREFDLADNSARTLARIEQELRDATWTPEQVEGADFAYRTVSITPGTPPRITKCPKSAAPAAGMLAEVDVLVVGGGTAGAPAAIAAARSGMRTLCVEYAGRLGGVTTEGGIGNYCFGLLRGFTSELDAGVKGFGSFYTVAKAEWLRATGRAAGVEYWFGCQAVGAVVEGRKVVGAKVAMPDGTYGDVRAKVVIDATGYALLAADAGESTEFLSADEISLQGAGSTPRLLGRNYQNTDAFFVDDTDPDDLSYQWLRARRSFGRHSWDQPSVVNSRERRRIHGAYYVTVQDAMNLRNYPDLFAVTYSNFDTHGQTIDPEFMIEVPHCEAGLRVNLPYRAILPARIDGLLVIGLGMSAHRDAMPILRMQPDLQNQGYGAGLAAALAVIANVPPRQIEIGILQRQLLAKGILTADELAAAANLPLANAELAAAVAQVGDGYRELKKVLSDPKRALPLVERAYAAAAMPSNRLAYAHVLGLMGSQSGKAELVAALNATNGWDRGWNYQGMHQFGRSLSTLDSYVIALANPAYRDDPAVLGALRAKAAILTGEDAYSHFRALSRAAEAIGNPALAQELARLLTLPGVGGHALKPGEVPPITGYNEDWPHLGVADRERSDCLRELSVARALYRLGDLGGLAERTLKAYTADPRKVYANHARQVLDSKK